MKKLLLLLILFSPATFALNNSQIGLGLGTQFGGGLGVNYALNSDLGKYYLGAGRTDAFLGNESYGVTIGWEKAITQKHAWGIALRTRTGNGGSYYQFDYQANEVTRFDVSDGYRAFLAGTYTYYFQESTSPGFLTGLSIGREYRKNNLISELKPGFVSEISFGYQF